MNIRGIWSGEVRATCERFSFFLKGADGEVRVEHALAVPNLSLPTQSVALDIVDKIERTVGIKLQPYNNVQPYILLGQDNWPLLRHQEVRTISGSGLVMSRSSLGWAVHGYTRIKCDRPHGLQANVMTETAERGDNVERDYEQLDELIRQYFIIDNLGVSEVRGRRHESAATKILRETTTNSGKLWSTGLLWKHAAPPETDGRATAIRRLHELERKLDRDSTYAALYYKEIERLQQNGYIQKVDARVSRSRTWFVPHFGVTNINKPNKIRIVFDGAAKTRGISLNDQLETGPQLLESLIGVLMRFRARAYAVTADIKDMYMRVEVIKKDRGAQRFLWRGDNRHKEPDVYEMTRLMFGTKSAPCCAIFVKNTNAERFVRTKPRAAESIRINCYVDDYLASGDSIDEMQKFVRDVNLINGEANFAMHGWASNDPRVVEHVSDDKKMQRGAKVSLCDDTDRVLGIYWDRQTDCLRFNVGLKKLQPKLASGNRKPTKREFFSVAMSVYDPLGILAPFTLRARLIMQDICRSGIGWDQAIRDEEFDAWKSWVGSLRDVQRCRVPRCYLPAGTVYGKTQLHVFTDASLQAYSAAAYLRVESPDGRVNVALVMAKSRVAPVKPLSVPRLETQGGVLGARLGDTVEKEIGIKIDERVFWTDSTTLLQWIRTGPRLKQAFVANRLGEIAELTRVGEWRWVPSKLNPADDATRATLEPMRSHDRWFTGPEFLRLPPNEWPMAKRVLASELQAIDKLEAKREYAVIAQTSVIELPIRVTVLGWEGLTCFARRVKTAVHVWVGVPREMDHTKNRTEAEKFWFREIQQACFTRELRSLSRNEALHRGSKLLGLMPYLDDEGLLRARGRLSRIDNVNVKNEPIILHADHHATKALIKTHHQRHSHASNETVVNEMRQQFYIVGLRSRLRWLAQNCITCRLRRAQPANPRMADLPAGRLAHGERPFTHCGIDYFGPIFVKIGRRREKRWGVLFTCLTVRAVWLDVASTLDASSTIMALQRMAALRGTPSHIYSDNGTNFVRASKELRDAIDNIDLTVQEKFARENRIQWHFNPPDAPHMGGAWERLVRSVKSALEHALSEHAPTEEVLRTVLSEIQHSINSRPLTHVSTDPRDDEALTPNHFLIGTSSGHLRLDKYEKHDHRTIDTRKRFEISQHVAQGFWKRWLREYLPTLLPRTKWQRSETAIRVGDIVLVVDYQAKRNTWKTGRVSHVYPGSDNEVRVAKVKIGKSDFVRPCHKLIKICNTEG